MNYANTDVMHYVIDKPLVGKNIVIVCNTADNLLGYRKNLLRALAHGAKGGKIILVTPIDDDLYSDYMNQYMTILSEYGIAFSLVKRSTYHNSDKKSLIRNTITHTDGPAKELAHILAIHDCTPKNTIILPFVRKPIIHSLAAALGYSIVGQVTGNGKFGQDSLVSRVMQYCLIKRVAITMSNDGRGLLFHNTSDQQYIHNLTGHRMRNSGVVNGSGVEPSVRKRNQDKPYQKNVSFDHRGKKITDAINIVTVAKVLPDKGIREIVALAEKHPDKYFTIIGDTKCRSGESLDLVMERLPKLTFLGKKSQKEIKEYIQDSTSVLLHPSYHEGLSRAVLEAGMCGVPVIGSDIPGVRPVLSDGRNVLGGRLVNLAGSVKQNAEAFSAAIDAFAGTSQENLEIIVQNLQNYIEITFSCELGDEQRFPGLVIAQNMDAVKHILEGGKFTPGASYMGGKPEIITPPAIVTTPQLVHHYEEA